MSKGVSWIVYIYTHSNVGPGVKKVREVCRLEADDYIIAMERALEIVASRVFRCAVKGIEVRRADAPSLKTLLKRCGGGPDDKKDRAWRAAPGPKSSSRNSGDSEPPPYIAEEVPDCCTVREAGRYGVF